MGMGSRYIVSLAYWDSSDSDDDDYYIPPISNTMARKKKQTKVVIPVKKLNGWQHLSREIMTEFDLSPTKRDSVHCRRCIK